MFDNDVIKKGINDQAVLQAMRDVDRRKFVSDKFSDVAYDDRALPIGEEQTISQPFIVAFMTESLQIEKGNKVLEVGTGSGFQTAVLSKLGAKVSTIEINKKLFKESLRRLTGLGYGDISFYHGDGNKGVSEQSPYDRILVTAAPAEIPRVLLGQLAKNGIMVIPVGNQSEVQYLYRIKKLDDDKIEKEKILPVHFVPLIKS